MFEYLDINNMNDEEILKSIIFAAPFFQKLAKEDFFIDVCNKEIWLAHFPGKNFDINVNVGSPVPKDDPVIQGALAGNGTIGRPPYELYGMHFIGKTFPIRNSNNDVIGALGIGYNIEELVVLEDTMEKLKGISTNFINAIEGVKSQAILLESSSELLFNNSSIVKENSDQISAFLDVIKNISSQTNILGLNASIEAARSGEYGRGFNVVAKEVRKLSQDTASASTKISEYTEKIKCSVNDFIESLNSINNSIDENSEIVKTLSAMSSELNSSSNILADYVKKLSEDK